MADEPTKTEEKKASATVTKIIESVEKLTVLELNELVSALEEKFGVSAMPVAAAATPAATPAGEGSEAEGGEKAILTVVLTDGGANKISVIKTVRELNQNLGLKEAKELVDTAPKEVLVDVDKETAAQAKEKLEAAGGKVELK